MRAEIAAAVAAYAGGGSMNVTETSRQLRISPKTFHKYVARFRQRGVPGFFPDSRRPLTSPTRLPVEWDEVLIRLRKQEAEAGWDYGADAVLMRLEEQPELWPTDWLPSRSSVNRIFERRGQLEKVPHRRPRRSSHRFQRERVNELWQFDGFKYDVADESEVVVLQLTDDCSRVDLALQAAASENGNDVWATFCAAVTRYGLPAALLSDNGAAFSGKRRGWTSMFEHQLEAVSVYALTSRVSHPQTCGKNERAHQRVQKWLKRRPPAAGTRPSRPAGAARHLPRCLQRPREQGAEQAHTSPAVRSGPPRRPRRPRRADHPRHQVGGVSDRLDRSQQRPGRRWPQARRQERARLPQRRPRHRLHR